MCDYYIQPHPKGFCKRPAREIWRQQCPSCNKFYVKGLCPEHVDVVCSKLDQRLLRCQECQHIAIPATFWQKVGDA